MMRGWPARAAVCFVTVAVAVALLIVLRIILGNTKWFFLSAAVITAATLTTLCILAVRWATTARSGVRSDADDSRLQYSFFRKEAGLPTRFTADELRSATDDFRELIGRGSSGSVFRGVLADGTAVAVKRIDIAGGAGGVREKEFKAEIAAIGMAQHRSLVHLLGFSFISGAGGHAGHRFLVYEFMANGSLDKWIFPERAAGCLSWPARFAVAVDVARALAYLHHDCRRRVLHFDVKPQNILLDGELRAHVTDFGFSKTTARDGESRVVTTFRGTTGYIAPEWLLGTGVSAKSDVYSYGMVLLELVGGCRNLRLDGGHWTYFPKTVVELRREGQVTDIVDGRIVDSVDERQLKTVVDIALWCIQEDGGQRPAMSRVVEMLEGKVAVEEPPEPEMLIVDLLSVGQDPGRAFDPQWVIRGSSSSSSSGSDGRQPASVYMGHSYEMSYVSGR